jgi:hypothetical protein
MASGRALLVIVQVNDRGDVRRWRMRGRAGIDPGSRGAASAHVHVRPSGPHRLGPPQHLARDGGDLARARDEEAEEVADGGSLRPLEVDAGLHAREVADGEEHRGDRVGDVAARDLEHAEAAAHDAAHHEVLLELRRVARGHLEEDHGRASKVIVLYERMRNLRSC